jgi:ParB-like chromosome segregation protein Spo0J
MVEVDSLGERLSALRLCEAAALAATKRSLAAHGQLAPVLVFADGEALQIIDGFKRVRAARSLGWKRLLVRVDMAGPIEAKLRLREAHDGRAFTELEEAWLVRSLHREDHLTLPTIGARLGRHKSWVWRRLMLVESLGPTVQEHVRLGFLAARAAVAVSRLPRGNQEAASKVVMDRGLTVVQTELLVDEALRAADAETRAALLERRRAAPVAKSRPGPHPKRGGRKDADWMSADVLRVHELVARLEARLMATPLAALPLPAEQLVRDALLSLVPILRSLDGLIAAATRCKP